MDTIVSILVLGAIYTIVYVIKNLTSSTGDVGKKVLGENFPSVEILEPDESVPVSSSAEPARTLDDVRQQRPRSANPISSASDNKPKEQVVKERKERLVNLQNRSEVKRAFLYSEIFNRKY